MNDTANPITKLLDVVKTLYPCKINYRVFDDRIVVAPHIFLRGYDESICNVFSFTEDGKVLICDGGSVTDYLEVMGENQSENEKIIAGIVSEYGLTFDGKSFFASSGFSASDLEEAVKNFLQALKSAEKINVFSSPF